MDDTVSMPRWIENNWVALILAGLVLVLAVALWALALRFQPLLGLALVLIVFAAGWGLFRLWTRRSVAVSDHWPMGKLAISMLAAAVGVGLLIQLVPYGRDHSNPPVTAEPAWDSARTRELAVLACFDCHSNEVEWPWYSNVAPMSWAVTYHVDAGRGKVNYSEWDQPQHDADESAETVREGSMPPAYYLLTHSDARLTDAEKRELAAGLAATIGEHDDD